MFWIITKKRIIDIVCLWLVPYVYAYIKTTNCRRIIVLSNLENQGHVMGIMFEFIKVTYVTSAVYGNNNISNKEIVANIYQNNKS